ncbi:hypothetical protein BDV95DRAFT_601553 [Massariosphaeria phaeospora]|uniref:Uncharacterized protein n=1 Tax=Massariosphaeria phaeospora TaxID=100035 RepID=A0A7C8MGR3_9PLEO|nr:hypothetical protein BDV95DRAFT_601553 [Massariosphaeria phaeospora]
MAHKRKRSTADFSPLSTSSFSTPEAQSPASLPSHNLHTPDAFPFHRRTTPWSLGDARRVKSSDLGCRTRKRVRDNRPDEREVHEHTINKLFSAQRTHPQPILLAPPSPPPPQPKVQKSTLHSFWNLPAPPVQAPAVPILLDRHISTTAPRCEDCEAPLREDGDSMDIDMDMDMHVAGSGGVGGGQGGQFACNGCGKQVCGTCAVVASSRHCLQCATTGRNARRWW